MPISLNAILTALSLSVSIGAFGQTFFLEKVERKRLILLSTTIFAILAISLATAIDLYFRERTLIAAQRKITDLLDERKFATLDQLYFELFPPIPASLLNDAVERMAKDGVLTSENIPTEVKSRYLVQVRVLSLNRRPPDP